MFNIYDFFPATTSRNKRFIDTLLTLIIQRPVCTEIIEYVSRLWFPCSLRANIYRHFSISIMDRRCPLPSRPCIFTDFLHPPLHFGWFASRKKNPMNHIFPPTTVIAIPVEPIIFIFNFFLIDHSYSSFHAADKRSTDLPKSPNSPDSSEEFAWEVSFAYYISPRKWTKKNTWQN